VSKHKPVPRDTADEIRELSAKGYGRNAIGMITGMSSATVRNVLNGTAKGFTERLTARQISSLLKGAFGPV